MLEKWSLWFKIRKEKQYDDIIDIDKIRIPKDFAATKPRCEKVINKTKYIDNKRHPEKPIEISKYNMMLTDGYIDYLVCKVLEIKYVPVKWV